MMFYILYKQINIWFKYKGLKGVKAFEHKPAIAFALKYICTKLVCVKFKDLLFLFIFAFALVISVYH